VFMQCSTTLDSFVLVRYVYVPGSDYQPFTRPVQVPNTLQFVLSLCILCRLASDAALWPTTNISPAPPKFAGRHAVPFAKGARKYVETRDAGSRSYFLQR